MSLSDKIITAPKELRCICGKCDLDHILKKDVKEFIHNLKKDLKDNVSLLNMREEENMLDIINKLAGDVLVGVSE